MPEFFNKVVSYFQDSKEPYKPLYVNTPESGAVDTTEEDVLKYHFDNDSDKAEVENRNFIRDHSLLTDFNPANDAWEKEQSIYSLIKNPPQNLFLDRNATVSELSKAYNADVFFLPISANEKLLLRFDKRNSTITIFNTTNSVPKFHVGASIDSADDNSLSRREDYKLYKTYKITKKDEKSINEMFEIISNMIHSDVSNDYFYTNVTSSCHLCEISENDNNKHPERYLPYKYLTAWHAAVVYMCDGAFPNSLTTQKISSKELHRSIYRVELQNLLLKAYNLKSASLVDSDHEEVKRLSRQMETVIQEFNTLVCQASHLYKNETITLEESQQLNATFQEVLQLQETCSTALKNSIKFLQPSLEEIYCNPTSDYPKPITIALRKEEAVTNASLIARGSFIAPQPIETANVTEQYLEKLEAFEFNNDTLENYKKAIEHLVDLNLHLQNYQPNLKNIEIIKNYLEKFFLAMPSLSADFKLLGSEAIHQHTILLDKLSNELHLLSSKNKKFSAIPIVSVLQYQFLANLEKLAKCTPTAKFENYRIYHHDFFKLIREDRFILDSHEVQQKTLDLARYFKPGYFFHKHVLEPQETSELQKDSILNSACALFNVVQSRLWKKFNAIIPLTWMPHRPSNSYDKNLDAEGKTYAYYKQFIEDPKVVEAWKKLGTTAPHTEADKVLWIAENVINDRKTLPFILTALQKTTIRCLPLDFASSHLEAPRATTEILSGKNFVSATFKALKVLFTPERNTTNPSTLVKNLETYEQDRKKLINEKGRTANSSIFFKLPLYSNSQNFIYQNNDDSKFATAVRDSFERSNLSYKEWAQIQANPLDNVNRLINYYQRHVSLLTQPVHREFLTSALFQFQRLELQLQLQPQFVNKIKEFLDDSIYHGLAYQNYSMVSDLCLLADKLSKFIAHIDVPNKPSFPDIKDFILKEVMPLCKKPVEFFWLYNALYGLEKDQRSKALYAANLLFTLEHANVTDAKLSFSNKDELLELAQTELEIDNGTLCKEIYNSLSKYYNFAERTSEIPVYVNGVIVCGEYKLDFKLGKVNYNNELYCTALPSNLLNPDYFNELFGQKIDHILPENYEKEFITFYDKAENAYILKPKSDSKQKAQFRITTFPGNKLRQLERIENGDRLLLLNLHECNNLITFYPTVFKVKTETARDVTKREKISAYAFWMKKDENKSEIIAIKHGKYDLSIHCEEADKQGQFTVKNITKGKLTLCRHDQVSHGVLDYFSRFAEFSQIEFWMNSKTNKLEKVILPTKGLSFNVDGSGRFISEQHNGYTIAQDINAIDVPLLPIAHPTMVLTNGTEYKQLFQAPYKKAPWIEANYVNKQWVPNDRYSRLALIQLLIAENRYTEVVQLFNAMPSISSLEPYEMKIVKELLTMQLPPAIELRLHLLHYEATIMRTPLQMDQTTIQRLYFQYLNETQLYPNLQLTNSEERRLLELFISWSEKSWGFYTKSLFTSFINSWHIYELRRSLRFFQDRLNVLEGGTQVHLSNIPILPSYKKVAAAHIKISTLQEQLHVFEEELKEYAKEVKRREDLTRVANFSEKKEISEEEQLIKVMGGIFNPAENFSPTKPPTNICKYFFFYYRYLNEIANSAKRAEFSKSLMLVETNEPEIVALVDILKSICAFPYGLPSLKILLTRYRAFKQENEKYSVSQDAGSVIKGITSYLTWMSFLATLSTITRFQWMKIGNNDLLQKVENCFSIASRWWNSTIKVATIKGRVSPYTRPFHMDTETPYHMQSIDAQANDEFRRLYNVYFKPDEQLKIRTVDRTNPIPEPTGNTINDRRQKRAKADLDEYFALTPDQRIPELISQEALPKLIKELETKIEKEELLHKIRMQDFLHKANQADGNFLAATMRIATRQQLEHEEFMHLFACATEEQFMARTTFTDANEFRKYLSIVTANFTRYSRCQQLRRTLKELNKAQKSPQAEKEIHIQEAANILRAMPAYVRTTKRSDRILLALEVNLGYLVRDDQLAYTEEVRKKFTQHNVLLMEAPFGWGKTELFRVLMNMILADGSKFVANYLPPMQEKDLVRQLERSHYLTFGKKITHLEITRETEFNSEQLAYIYRRMLTELKEGNIEAFQPDAYLHFRAHMLLHCHKMGNINPKLMSDENRDRLKYYLMIQSLLYEKGLAIAEEEDKVFANINRLMIALDEGESYNPRYARLVREILDFLLADKELNELFKIAQNAQERVTAEEIRTIVGPKLVAHFGGVFPLQENEKVHFNNFILCTGSKAEYNAAVRWAEKNEHYDLYAHLKGMILACLEPASRGRINAINGYDLPKLHPDLKFPIPTWAKDKPKETVLGPSQNHPDIGIIRAFYYYLAKGLTPKDIDDLIVTLKNNAEKEAQGCSLDKTVAAIDLEEMIKNVGLPEGEDPADYKLSQIKGRKLNILIKQFKNHPAAINYYVQHVVAPQILIFKMIIEVSMQNLLSMTKKSLSLSATPQHKGAHARDTVYIPMKKTAGGIACILLVNTNDNGKTRLNVLEKEETEELVAESAAHTVKEYYSALVEGSPTFSSITNIEAAQIYAKALKPTGKFQGILFCDETDKKYKVLNFNSGEITALEGYEQEELFKLYSEADASNIHWVSAISAMFKVMVGPRSTLEQIGQAAGRARLTHLLQKIGFEIQNSTLNKKFNNKADINPLEMFMFLLNNSAIAEAMNDFIGLNDQMENEVQDLIIKKMCGTKPEPDVEKALEIFQANPSVFVKENINNSWDRYAHMRPGVPTTEALEQQQKHWMSAANNLKQVGFFDIIGVRRRLQNYDKKWKGDDAIPLTPTVDGHCEGINAHVEIIRHNEFEPHVNPAPIEPYTSVEYAPDTFPADFNIFRSGRWWVPSRIRHTIDKITTFAYGIFHKIWEKMHAIIPTTYLATLGSVVFGIAIVDVAEVAAARIVGIAFGVFFGNVIGWLATGVSSIACGITDLVVKNVGVTYDTHYIEDIIRPELKGRLKSAAKMFRNKNLKVLISNDKVKHWPGNFRRTQVPFKPDAKPLLQIAVIVEHKKDRKGKLKEELTLIDLDMNLAGRIKADLIEDHIKTSSEDASKPWIAIYDIETEDAKTMEEKFVTGKNGFDVQESGFDPRSLLKNPLFHIGVAQLKLANGYTKFLHDELNVVPSLVDRMGIKNIHRKNIAEDFIQNVVLKNKPIERSRYTSQPLAAFINPAVRSR